MSDKTQVGAGGEKLGRTQHDRNKLYQQNGTNPFTKCKIYVLYFLFFRSESCVLTLTIAHDALSWLLCRSLNDQNRCEALLTRSN